MNRGWLLHPDPETELEGRVGVDPESEPGVKVEVGVSPNTQRPTYTTIPTPPRP